MDIQRSRAALRLQVILADVIAGHVTGKLYILCTDELICWDINYFLDTPSQLLVRSSFN
jgi:hypothetical protein